MKGFHQKMNERFEEKSLSEKDNKEEIQKKEADRLWNELDQDEKAFAQSDEYEYETEN